MIQPHDWRGDGHDKRECSSCGCTYAFATGSWRLGSAELFEEPPCPLVPPSAHTLGPWRVDNHLKPQPWRDAIAITVHENDMASPSVLAWLTRGHEHPSDLARLIAQSPALRDAAEATILFHTPGWDDARAARWRELVGDDDLALASPRTLLEFVRRCLR